MPSKHEGDATAILVHYFNLVAKGRGVDCQRHCPASLHPEKSVVEASWNVMAHAQKSDFVFQRKGRVHLNRLGGGGAVQSTTGSRGVGSSYSNAGYTMFRGSVKGTGYPLHSPVSPSLPLPCVTVCHHISTGVYHILQLVRCVFEPV